jgi:hypothetical protein
MNLTEAVILTLACVAVYLATHHSVAIRRLSKRCDTLEGKAKLMECHLAVLSEQIRLVESRISLLLFETSEHACKRPDWAHIVAKYSEELSNLRSSLDRQIGDFYACYHDGQDRWKLLEHLSSRISVARNNLDEHAQWIVEILSRRNRMKGRESQARIPRYMRRLSSY